MPTTEERHGESILVHLRALKRTIVSIESAVKGYTTAGEVIPTELIEPLCRGAATVAYLCGMANGVQEPLADKT